MLDFDAMLVHVGEFGLYQKILFVFQAPFCIFVTFVLFGQLFMVLYPMNYWCEQHFACISIESNISAAQRRNISFAWRDRWLFEGDPCDINNIDDQFLQNLDRWDKRECAANRSVQCRYNDSSRTTGFLSTQPPKGEFPFPTLPGPPPRLQLPGSRSSEGWPLDRQKRHYGSYAARTQGWKQPKPFTTSATTTTEQSREFGADGWGGSGEDYEDNYGGGNGHDRDRPTGNGGNFGQTSRPQQGGGFGSSTTSTTTSRSTTRKPANGGTSSENSGRPGSAQSQVGQPNPNNPSDRRPSGGKARNRDRGRPTEVTSAFAGWPQPECNKDRRFPLFLGMNSRIMAQTMMRRSNNSLRNGPSKHCTVRWNQSEVPFQTIVTEGDWWCEAEKYTTIAQAVFFLGAIVGGFLIGWIADTFGRVPALVIANILGALGGALSAVSTKFWVFCIFRFITGMAFDNCFTMMYILVLEFCGPSYRTLVANLSIAVFYTLGTIALPILAWLISDWRIYALVISLPMLLGLLALFFVPESARWLLSKGRAKEATQILRNFAKVNRRKVDEHVFVNFEQEATQLFSQLEVEEEEPSLGAAFRTPRLRRTFILLILFWALIALVYDGHSRNIMNLANDDLNVFWLFGIASMTEFPADMLLIFTLDRFGRRWLAFGSMTLSGAFSFVAAAVTPEMRIQFLITAIISRFWVNVAFNIGLQYAAELLPTVIRAQGVNAIHIMGYVASIISPFVAAIGRSNPTLSLFLLGGCSIAAGAVALFLSETLGEELPNTLEEAEAFGRNQSFWNCPLCAKDLEEEYPIAPPAALEDRPVVMRNALRGSIRGETYRSSMISNAPSVAGSRKSQLFGPGLGGGGKGKAPQPTEMGRLRRVTTH